ncbi:hypothetical protein FGIG_06094 [Fasciola gigantica]|uniref:Uncharacterized protein n=1 Tax=Fasciola gigantica TaxID=46835 RepID=A0A504Z473_FASGI|nr:hypothetical protein FGIG_06094 [Fasciola gigantica]
MGRENSNRKISSDPCYLLENINGADQTKGEVKNNSLSDKFGLTTAVSREMDWPRLSDLSKGLDTRTDTNSVYSWEPSRISSEKASIRTRSFYLAPITEEVPRTTNISRESKKHSSAKYHKVTGKLQNSDREENETAKTTRSIFRSYLNKQAQLARLIPLAQKVRRHLCPSMLCNSVKRIGLGVQFLSPKNIGAREKTTEKGFRERCMIVPEFKKCPMDDLNSQPYTGQNHKPHSPALQRIFPPNPMQCAEINPMGQKNRPSLQVIDTFPLCTYLT